MDSSAFTSVFTDTAIHVTNGLQGYGAWGFLAIAPVIVVGGIWTVKKILGMMGGGD